MMGIIKWLSEKVQNFSGEAERRKLVEQATLEYNNFRKIVEKWIYSINTCIEEYNDVIKKINFSRLNKTDHNIGQLSNFLGKFGAIKCVGEYYPESVTKTIEIPVRKFQNTEEYLNGINLTKDEVFYRSLESGAFGTRKENRINNLSMKEWIKKFKINSEHTINQLKMLQYTVEKNKEIADMYIYCVEFINNYIDTVILPELDIVEAFFQASAIKNELLCNPIILGEVSFRERNPIEILKDTPYKSHYLFVKNTFMFYIISCKIYNTPILTQLISEDEDVVNSNYSTMKKNKETLELQWKKIEQNKIVR